MHLTVLVSFAFSFCQIFASEQSEQKIEDCLQKLKSSEDRSAEDWDVLSVRLPNLGKTYQSGDPVTQLYAEGTQNKFKALSRGQDAQVFQVTLAHDRPLCQLKSGHKIALRMASFNDEYSRKSAAITLRHFNFLQEMNELYIKFYPGFYGAYLATGKDRYSSIVSVQCQEMELMEGTIAARFNVGNDYNWRLGRHEIPDAFIFEWCLGEWASAYFASLRNEDNKMENFGVLTEPSARVYKIEMNSRIVFWEVLSECLRFHS